MAKKVDPSVLTAALNKVATATTLVFCSAEPANYAGIAAVALVTKTGLTAGSFTVSAPNNSSPGTVTVAAQSNMTPSANGTVTYAVLHDGSTLLAGTTVTSQAVTTAQTWNSPTFTYTINQPT